MIIPTSQQNHEVSNYPVWNNNGHLWFEFRDLIVEAKTSGEEYKTEYLTISDLENPSIDEFYAVDQRQSTDLRAFFYTFRRGRGAIEWTTSRKLQPLSPREAANL